MDTSIVFQIGTPVKHEIKNIFPNFQTKKPKTISAYPIWNFFVTVIPNVFLMYKIK